ncbi:FUSC family protein [Melissococcus plutonius]|uniref:Integral membrane bound transporter domain-containing protein n=1 Tax=Melissococcus plutonius TaxID=33970 RepID=A0A2Z5Y1W7_9ENTE|nr:FUSC family protein [Melissococcus plutonius]BAL61860.1 hypothetical protein MPD5_0593 [Melissococcus plutonius DAT561]MCV2499323.1 FUSC family protein [Melissococcus plutonius]MCV2500966.1 FUSC family protein [Melissococcus plutonius]MCV2505606.1 FUSC family protein [Melissococcus plutonius]MCV2507913.1 FUSC family protein [Melissococcus plutonius]
MSIGPFRLGMRTLKSALSVMLCVLLFHFLDRGSPMIASLSAVFSLRQDLTTTLSFSRFRIIGNTIGGTLALIFVILTKNYFTNTFLSELLLLPLLIILIIVISDSINNNSGIIAAVSTFLIISLSIPQADSIHYTIERIFDTFIGTFIAIGLNFILKPKPIEKEKEIEEDIKKLTEKEKELQQLRMSVKKRMEEEKNKNQSST